MINKEKGFTLLELMIVVVVLSVLSSMVMPKLVNLLTKTKQGSTKGKLGVLRTAVNFCYIDKEGEWPGFTSGTIEELVPKYIEFMPYVDVGIPHETVTGCAWGSRRLVHERSNEVTDRKGDDGKWYYDENSGVVFVNCTHTDIKGVQISVW